MEASGRFSAKLTVTPWVVTVAWPSSRALMPTTTPRATAETIKTPAKTRAKIREWVSLYCPPPYDWYWYFEWWCLLSYYDISAFFRSWQVKFDGVLFWIGGLLWQCQNIRSRNRKSVSVRTRSSLQQQINSQIAQSATKPFNRTVFAKSADITMGSNALK